MWIFKKNLIGLIFNTVFESHHGFFYYNIGYKSWDRSGGCGRYRGSGEGVLRDAIGGEEEVSNGARDSTRLWSSFHLL